LLLCVVALVTGCDRNSNVSFTPEDSDPQFEHGRQLSKQGRNPEALASFLKVIAKRGDEAPESHMEAAMIYQRHIKDYLSAIYHYRKYIELQPNSRQTELVKQQIDACKREFARTLPAHPLEDASVKLGYLDQLDRLQRENEQLKAEIIALRAGIPSSPVSSTTVSRGGFDLSSNTIQPVRNTPPPAATSSQAEPSGEEDSPFLRAPATDNDGAMQSVAENNTGGTTSGITLSRPTAPTRPATTQTSTPTSAAAGRKHIVAPKDTLFSLSMRYYGTRSRWKEILQANRDVLKSENETLRVGMELRIP
jgi:tetratricopeptide (TPR) repeat protein